MDVVLEEHLLQDGLVHLLDVVIEELLPLGEHLVVEHVPGELLLHASKPRHLPLTLPFSSWLADQFLAGPDGLELLLSNLSQSCRSSSRLLIVQDTASQTH